MWLRHLHADAKQLLDEKEDEQRYTHQQLHATFDEGNHCGKLAAYSTLVSFNVSWSTILSFLLC